MIGGQRLPLRIVSDTPVISISIDLFPGKCIWMLTRVYKSCRDLDCVGSGWVVVYFGDGVLGVRGRFEKSASH